MLIDSHRVDRGALMRRAAVVLGMLASADCSAEAWPAAFDPPPLTPWLALSATLCTLMLLMLWLRARHNEVAARGDAARLLEVMLAWSAALPAAIIIKDARGQFLVVNTEAERITGCSAADLQSGTGLRSLPLAQWRWLLGEDPHSRALTASETVEQNITTAQGQAQYRITRGPLRTASGAPTGLFWIGHDITEQRETERRLCDSEAWYRLLFDANPCAMGVYDRETLQFLATNAAAQRQYGHSAEAFLAMSLHDIRPPAEQTELTARLALAIPTNDGTPQATGLWLHRRKDGSCFEADVVISNLTFNHRPARLALARDVSPEREAQRKIDDYQRDLLSLPQRLLSHERDAVRRVAQVVHDGLGHALAVARMKVELARIELQQQPNPALKDTLDQVTEQLDSAAGWMRSVLLDLRPPLLEEAGLAAALQHAIDSQTLSTGAASIQLKVDVACRTVRWPAAVEHVVFQLAKEALVNAGVHAQASEIEVTLAGQADGLALNVADNGVGIPGEMVLGRAGHLGITGMHERATAVGGRVVVSPLKTGGTVVTFTWGKTT